MDKIVGSDAFFLLEHWLASARSWGGNDTALTAVYEFNARNQITLWGPNGEIKDYASKQFGDLISTYYRPRWELFFGYLSNALADGIDFDEEEFNSECLKMEQAWQYSQRRYPAEPTGDSYVIANELYGKYETLLLPVSTHRS
jgi:alpha-N-acetylglucosaminidase